MERRENFGTKESLATAMSLMAILYGGKPRIDVEVVGRFTNPVPYNVVGTKSDEGYVFGEGKTIIEFPIIHPDPAYNSSTITDTIKKMTFLGEELEGGRITRTVTHGNKIVLTGTLDDKGNIRDALGNVHKPSYTHDSVIYSF
ncbi:MAG: hypothetical protein H6500_01155 [Candidatus Woesearchaeota archaeon]|nr:hypothetical protein [Nanoarchaeota archaeon]USN44440.1 MAG: hypothetical protein H6500_01155 [Candidatus Woesearchaeota archaeon]